MGQTVNPFSKSIWLVHCSHSWLYMLYTCHTLYTKAVLHPAIEVSFYIRLFISRIPRISFLQKNKTTVQHNTLQSMCWQLKDNKSIIRSHCMHSIDAAYCYTCCSMVCLLETLVIHAKTAELIEMQLGMWALWAHVIVTQDTGKCTQLSCLGVPAWLIVIFFCQANKFIHSFIHVLNGGVQIRHGKRQLWGREGAGP